MPSQDTFEPSVSFIIPNYNSAVSLALCLDGISALSYPSSKVEVLVIDNGSEDTSHEVAREKGVKLIVDKESHVSGLRNRGAKQASGDILVFLDSDCIIDPEWLNTALRSLVSEEVGMVGSKTHVLPEESGWLEHAWKVHLDFSASEQNPSWIVTRAIAVKKQIFSKVGGFDETLETCEDVAFGHEVSSHCRIENIAALAPIHLEDASDLKTFFSKEVWRGLGSVKTSLQFFKEVGLSQGVVPLLKEGLSLLLPFYFLFGVLLLIFSSSFIFSIVFLFLPILLITTLVCAKTSRFDSFFKLFFLYALYISARVWSFLVAICRG